MGSTFDAVAAPPGAQFGALRHLLLEHALRLRPGSRPDSECWRRRRCSRAGGPAVCWSSEVRGSWICGEAGAQAFELLHELLAIAAPADIVFHGDGLQVGAGDGLIAGVQDLFVAVLRDVDFAFESRETREPLTPLVTLNTVPVTATRQSAVAT